MSHRCCLRRLLSLPLLALIATSPGCRSAADQVAKLHSTHEREFTLGTVQAGINHGMSQSEVAEALGSPNIVTTDRSGDATWIYDKIASEASYAHNRTGLGGIAGAGGEPGSTLVLGGITGRYLEGSGATATTQRTLTVIIKFDPYNRVKDFSYHATRF